MLNFRSLAAFLVLLGRDEELLTQHHQAAQLGRLLVEDSAGGLLKAVELVRLLIPFPKLDLATQDA